uniref:Uncharacterized protein n=1 Tax=Solanum tuberosum TaxID=4113 RepID=M1DZL0_SOLTU
MDEHNFDQAQPYIEQLINSENHNQTQDHDDQSNELTNSTGGTDESGILEARKLRGPTLLNDIWKLPPGKTIDVAFNSGTQAIGKEGQKFSSFLGIIARTPVLTPLHIGDWRNFDNEEKKKLLNFVRFPGADSGHGQITQTTGIPSVAENTPTSHGITHLCPLVLLFELPQSHLHCC